MEPFFYLYLKLDLFAVGKSHVYAEKLKTSNPIIKSMPVIVNYL